MVLGLDLGDVGTIAVLFAVAAVAAFVASAVTWRIAYRNARSAARAALDQPVADLRQENAGLRRDLARAIDARRAAEDARHTLEAEKEAKPGTHRFRRPRDKE
jgi:hypothetical protein